MLTEEEKRFIEYWENNRGRRKRLWQQLAIGMPLAALFALAIFINFFSGWYKRADMELRSSSSLILVVLVAVIATAVFTTVFSVKHKWDRHEQRYQELLGRKDKT